MNRVGFKNVGEVARKIEAMAAAGGESLVSGLKVIGESIVTDVRASRPGAGVPKDLGPLAASLRANETETRKVVELAAGGAAEPYALVQHERLDYHHDLGEARYWVRGFERWERGGSPEAALSEVMDEVVRIGKATR